MIFPPIIIFLKMFFHLHKFLLLVHPCHTLTTPQFVLDTLWFCWDWSQIDYFIMQHTLLYIIWGERNREKVQVVGKFLTVWQLFWFPSEVFVVDCLTSLQHVFTEMKPNRCVVRKTVYMSMSTEQQLVSHHFYLLSPLLSLFTQSQSATFPLIMQSLASRQNFKVLLSLSAVIHLSSAWCCTVPNYSSHPGVST